MTGLEFVKAAILSLGPNALRNQPKDCTNPHHIACPICEPELFEEQDDEEV